MLEKINLNLCQHYHAANAIDSIMQEFVYLVINIILIKEDISKEEILGYVIKPSTMTT